MPNTMLDIGSGGGFPALPIAIKYPKSRLQLLIALQKIRAIESIAKFLGVENLTPVCSRVEKLDGTFDVVTSRAVSSLKNICEYALPKLKKGGYFVAYKSRKTPEEIDEASKVLKKYKAKIVEIIEYKLPLDEDHTRNLIVIKSL